MFCFKGQVSLNKLKVNQKKKKGEFTEFVLKDTVFIGNFEDTYHIILLILFLTFSVYVILRRDSLNCYLVPVVYCAYFLNFIAVFK